MRFNLKLSKINWKMDKKLFWLLVVLGLFAFALLNIFFWHLSQRNFFRNHILNNGNEIILKTISDGRLTHKTYLKDKLKIATQIYDFKGDLVKQDGYIADGIVNEYAYDGNLLSETPYRNNLKDGVAREYDYQGNLLTETRYFGAKKEEFRRIYNKNGDVKAIVRYKDGQKEAYEEYDDNAVILLNSSRQNIQKRVFRELSYQPESFLEIKNNLKSEELGIKEYNGYGVLQSVELFSTSTKNMGVIINSVTPNNTVRQLFLEKEYYASGVLKTKKTYFLGHLIEVVTYSEKGFQVSNKKY